MIKWPFRRKTDDEIHADNERKLRLMDVEDLIEFEIMVRAELRRRKLRVSAEGEREIDRRARLAVWEEEADAQVRALLGNKT